MYLGASGIIIVSAVINYSDLDKVLDAIDEALNNLKEDEINLDEIKNHFLSNIYK